VKAKVMFEFKGGKVIKMRIERRSSRRADAGAGIRGHVELGRPGHRQERISLSRRRNASMVK